MQVHMFQGAVRLLSIVFIFRELRDSFAMCLQCELLCPHDKFSANTSFSFLQARETLSSRTIPLAEDNGVAMYWWLKELVGEHRTFLTP